MATAAQVVKAILQRIIVQEAEADLDGEEVNDVVFAMNNYMLALDADGIRLGYTEITTIGQEVTIPTGALRGLIANVAVEIAPDYGAVATPELVRAAEEGLETMEKLGVAITTSAMPSTLPRGSGNRPRNGFANSLYYPDEEAVILAETIGAIGLETGTEEAI